MKRSITFIILLIIAIACFIMLKGYLYNGIKENKERNTNVALEYMNDNLQEQSYKKVSESNLVSNSASKEILIRYNGILYGKSFTTINYSQNSSNIIGKIDKVTDNENIPILNGETNREEFLNAEICNINDKNMFVNHNNEVVTFEKIIEYDNLDFNITVKANNSMKKERIIDSSDISIFYYSLDNASITIKGNQEYDLKYALENKLVSIKDIIDKAEADVILNKVNVDVYKDGGSKLYDYGTYKILKLYSLNGNDDLYIGIPEIDINSLNV